MASTIWGLCFYDVHYRVLTLPLLRVKAAVTIKEINAQVKLTQTFGNDSPNPIEAIYSFPVPARAAVCGFTMIRQNGTRVVAVVQEKAEAQQTYNTAVAQGKTASLMVQQTPDVFQVSVGNIAPKEEVQIELVYATELTEDEESDSVRFLLPVHIGSRYGSGPSVFTPSSSSFIDINVAIETMTPIRKIGCPSHSISTELGPDPALPNANELPFSNYARVSLSADTPLQKDFILTILSAGLDTPRCVAELHPEHDTVGMALTLVPRFSLPDRPNQEFIFLVDRSGSMGGNRIAAARKALVVMLRSLPHKNTVFQIASFGSHADMLWKAGSRPYNQETLDEATKFVDGMGSNYGGTEIRMALSMCFRARDKNRATSIFLLTDGDAWDLNGVLEEVTSAVDAAPLKTRVFCLGIGDSASTAMCEGIARVGNGSCMMVGEQESTMTGKIARLVKAAKSPLIKDIRVDWGRPEKATLLKVADDDEFELVESEQPVKAKAPLNIFDETANHMDVDPTPPPPPPAVVLPPPIEVQQSPVKIRTLLPGVRLYVYAILKGKRTVPKTVTIRAKTEDDAEIDLPVTVAFSNLPNAPKGTPPAVHALAARKIIQDFEDGRYDEQVKKDNPAVDLKRVVKAHIVRLGKTYAISSTHTSFVAVDETTPPQRYAPQPPPPPPMLFGASNFGQNSPVVIQQQSMLQASPTGYARPPPPRPAFSFGAPPPPPGRMAPTTAPFAAYSPARPFSFGSPGGVGSAPPWAPPQSWSLSSSATTGSSGASPASVSFGAAAPAGDDLMGLTFAAPALMPCSVDPQTMEQYNAELQAASIAPLPDEDDFYGDLGDSAPVLAPAPASASARAPPPAEQLEALARRQAFDGSFSMDVLQVVNPALKPEDARAAFDHGLDDKVIATVLAMAFISGKIGGGAVAEDKAAWEGMYEKAESYLEDVLGGVGVSVDELFVKVFDLIA